MKKTIANTTVISNFAAVRRLDLLHSLLGRLHISSEVYEEIRQGLAEGYDFYEGIEGLIYPFSAEGWIELVSLEGVEELRRYGEVPDRLHRGEASCLVIAREREWALLTDDQEARKMAREWKIEFSGTLGVLVRCVEMGLLALEDGNNLLQRMIKQANYRTPYTDLAMLLEV